MNSCHYEHIISILCSEQCNDEYSWTNLGKTGQEYDDGPTFGLVITLVYIIGPVGTSHCHLGPGYAKSWSEYSHSSNDS